MSEVIDVDEVYEPSDLDVSSTAENFATKIGSGVAAGYKMILPQKKSSRYISFSEAGRVSFSDTLLEEVEVMTGTEDSDAVGSPTAGDYVLVGLNIEKTEVKKMVDVPLKSDPSRTKKEEKIMDQITTKSLVFEFYNKELVEVFADDVIDAMVYGATLCEPTSGNTKHIQAKRWLKVPELKQLLSAVKYRNAAVTTHDNMIFINLLAQGQSKVVGA